MTVPAAPPLRLFGGDIDKGGADTAPSTVHGDEGVRDEGMLASVTDHVDEADKLIAVVGANPEEAVRAHRVPVDRADLRPVVDPDAVERSPRPARR